MKICLAQTKAIPGNIEANIANHVKWIKKSADYSPDLIGFPELSLTGYEPTLASALAFGIDDPRLRVFQDLSNQYQLAIAVGMPLTLPEGIHIGMITFHPHLPKEVYTKQQLHADETPCFIAGDQQTILTIGQTRIALAICYESMQMSHFENCVSLGADIYLASVCKDQKGITKAYDHYSTIAESNSIPILMVNSVGPSDNFISAGQSACWNSYSQITEQLNSSGEGLMIYDNFQ